MKTSIDISALVDASHVLLDAGRKESCIAILSGHPKDSYTLEALKLLNRIKREPGVSVIMATYKGAGRITRALESLVAQTMDRSRFEVIIVHNGPEDGTKEVVEQFGDKHRDLNIVFMRSEPAGAGNARNAGCAAARFDHMTFLDDDDLLSPDFLRELYALSNGEAIIFSQIIDFDETGHKESLVNKKLLADFKDRATLKPAEAPGAATALTMTCIKMFPSYIPEVTSYDLHLRNGEDVVFWTEALARFDPDLILCPPEKNAIYYREVRQDSISRQPLSFQFNILDRIDVAKLLKGIYEKYPTDFVKQKMLAIAYFMASYLRENPEDYLKVRKLIDDEIGANFGVMQYINKSLSKALAVSYCFPPWVDTAGVVAAKRMLVAGKPFDAISNEMKPFRDIDPGLKGIAHDLTGDHVELKIPTKSTIDTQSIVNFSRRALAYTANLNKYRKYEQLYSRAMWPASHFAAGAIKVSIPNIHWVAEFSDPMVTDILSQKRPGKMDMEWLAETGIKDAIRDKGFPDLESDSLMEWCEYIAYTLADEILFTNENQRNYMLSQPWIAALRGEIEGKTVVSPHPTLPAEYYNRVEDSWRPPQETVNIGYFGSFYKTRGLTEVLQAIAETEEAVRRKISLHIYTAATPELEKSILEAGVAANVMIHQPLPYFAFLARCKAYDFLLVNDAATRGIKPFNPYLPSKVSDYLGAGTRIWALVEEGSPLSGMELPSGSFFSELGNQKIYRLALEEMVRNKEDLRLGDLPSSSFS